MDHFELDSSRWGNVQEASFKNPGLGQKIIPWDDRNVSWVKTEAGGLEMKGLASLAPQKWFS